MAGDIQRQPKYSEIEVSGNLKALYSTMFHSDSKIVKHELFNDYMELYFVNNSPILPGLAGIINKIKIYYEFNL